MKQYRTRTISAFPPIALFLVSVGSLGFAFYAQYVQKLLPCVLCLYQRVPFYGVAGLSVIALLLLHFPAAARFVVYLCGITFAVGTAIAFYHVGVQELWWQGPAMCGGVESGASSVADLKAQLMAQPIIRCDKIDWKLFGITMPTVNLFFSAALTVFCLIAPSRWMKK
ncbi:MAG: disulfide bond formation protein B [Thalassospira sp.]|uniref:disulfide bond formation protein B n=1 Tax=Thalassospira sp. GB04J01 TaxID=1485225 RepID=UPI000C0FC420|nr:disulfide bond formation protein B [Thalassospira sp. GB04J01]MBV17226.1 disulfide bond formation protein B [Thalassospira sp.]|tara:strand:- start:16006 stop:16509 length:504 start_codon:yes stop_codon:yes gene_type:complete